MRMIDDDQVNDVFYHNYNIDDDNDFHDDDNDYVIIKVLITEMMIIGKWRLKI